MDFEAAFESSLLASDLNGDTYRYQRYQPEYKRKGNGVPFGRRCHKGAQAAQEPGAGSTQPGQICRARIVLLSPGPTPSSTFDEHLSLQMAGGLEVSVATSGES